MPEYTITEWTSGFSVYPPARSVTITTLRDGQYASETKPFAKVFHGATPSTFDASYLGDDEWQVDLDCGAQRRCGTKTTREVRRALRNCGFDANTINALVSKYQAKWEPR